MRKRKTKLRIKGSCRVRCFWYGPTTAWAGLRSLPFSARYDGRAFGNAWSASGCVVGRTGPFQAGLARRLRLYCTDWVRWSGVQYGPAPDRAVSDQLLRTTSNWDRTTTVTPHWFELHRWGQGCTASGRHWVAVDGIRLSFFF
jgi:hypothetical protein